MSTLTQQGRWAVGMLVSSGMIAFLSIFLGRFRDETLSRMATFQVLFTLGTVAAWLAWQYRTHARLHETQIQGLSFTPGASIGWWFVPFVNLVRPYMAIKEIWQASETGASDDNWKGRPVTPMLRFWWITFIVSNLVGNFASRAEDKVANTVGSLSAIGLIVAAVLAVLIVREVDQRLSDRPPAATPETTGIISMLGGAAVGAIIGALIWWLLFENLMSGVNRGSAFGPDADPDTTAAIEASFSRLRLVAAVLLGGITGTWATIFGKAKPGATIAASAIIAVGGVLVGNSLLTAGVFGGYLYDFVPSPFNAIGALVATVCGAGSAWAAHRLL